MSLHQGHQGYSRNWKQYGRTARQPHNQQRAVSWNGWVQISVCVIRKVYYEHDEMFTRVTSVSLSTSGDCDTEDEMLHISNNELLWWPFPPPPPPTPTLQTAVADTNCGKITSSLNGSIYTSSKVGPYITTWKGSIYTPSRAAPVWQPGWVHIHIQ